MPNSWCCCHLGSDDASASRKQRTETGGWPVPRGIPIANAPIVKFCRFRTCGTIGPEAGILTIIADIPNVTSRSMIPMRPVMRHVRHPMRADLLAIMLGCACAVIFGNGRAATGQATESLMHPELNGATPHTLVDRGMLRTAGGIRDTGLIDADGVMRVSHLVPSSFQDNGHPWGCDCDGCDAGWLPPPCGCGDPCCDCFDPNQQSYGYGADSNADLYWLNGLRVGYDDGFLIASRYQRDLNTDSYPFQLRFNGWGQLRHTVFNSAGQNIDQNQFQLKRGRLLYSGVAFNPNFSYLVQLDGRSSSGDDVRLLDYYLSYDFGHGNLGLRRGELGFRTGKYKMPFTMARWLSGKEFEFTDRSVASMFFDVNRSFAWGLYGATRRLPLTVFWETAIFNGLVTGGAETGSTGTLDDNFAYSFRAHSYPIGRWGSGALADLDWHERLAMRVGFGYAASTIERVGQTEFNTLRVIDSGQPLADILPTSVRSYSVSLYSVDASIKYRGWSQTLEYYFRTIDGFKGADVPNLFDHGFWFQLGYFLVPGKFQIMARWSREVGNSGTLGVKDESDDEVAGGIAWYFNENHAKGVLDLTHLNGAPIDSSSLDILPGYRGWLMRSQIQFSF